MTVGLRTGVLFDDARPAWDGTGPRPIAWTAWYPADEHAAATVPADPSPDASWFHRSPVADAARPRDLGGPRPVVLLSHGTGGTARELAWLAHGLAQRGVVALAPEHHGNTGTEPFRAEGFLCWWERARDLTVLLDHMLTAETLVGRLDGTRVFTAGFSLGAHTALSLLGAVSDMEAFAAWARGAGADRGPRNFPDLGGRIPTLMAESAAFRDSWARQGRSYRDARVRAALLLAPAPPVRAFTAASLAAIAAPVHMVSGGADADAPVAVGGAWLLERLPSATLDIVAPQGGHLMFLPQATDAGRAAAPDRCVDAPGVDRALVHAAVVDAADRLFGG